MIKVLVAGLVGTVAGVVVMIIVIVAAGTRTSGASTVGLGPLSTPTASLSGSSGSSTPPPASSGGSSTPTSSGGSGQGNAANGKTIFTGSGGCGSCHVLSAAGTTGAVGPSLDSLSGDAQKAGMPLDAFIKESIVNPGAYVAPGYSNGIMPATFGSTLSASDIADLVALISSSQK